MGYEYISKTSETEKRGACKSAKVIPEHHCCLDMAFAISKPTFVQHQGKNRIIDWIASSNEYRIPVPYDGYVSTLIKFCPFCGTKLGESKHKEWRDTLQALGYTDPGEEKIPAEFEDDRWWRKK